MGELEAVKPLADLANERAVLVELEQPRVAAARVDEDVTLRVGGDADALTEVEIRGQLEEIWHRRVRDDGDVFRLRFRLRHERRSGREDGDGRSHASAEQMSVHDGLPNDQGNLPDRRAACNGESHRATPARNLSPIATR